MVIGVDGGVHLMMWWVLGANVKPCIYFKKNFISIHMYKKQKSKVGEGRGGLCHLFILEDTDHNESSTYHAIK
jgi:hypothetical protein